MRVRVKICGISSAEAAAAAIEAGADAVGFVFAESPRQVTIERALELASHVPPFVTRVAVFRYPNPDQVMEVVRRFQPSVVQSEPGDGVNVGVPLSLGFLPVFHDGPGVVSQVCDYGGRPGNDNCVLLEGAGRGGLGTKPDWTRAAEIAQHTRLVLAGGLTPENVGEAIRIVRAHGVDVSSGVESKGVKDPARIFEFIEAVRSACAAGALEGV